MNFDENTRQRLLGMSDAELKALISAICDAAGADSTRAALLQSNISGVKNAIGSMSISDAEKLLSNVGRDKAEEISRILRGI